MRRTTAGSALLAATLGAVALAGCGGTTASAPPPSTAATLPTTSVPAVTTAPPEISAQPTVTATTAKATPTASRSTAAPVRSCAGLTPSLGSSHTAGGYTSVQLRLRNAGSVACTVGGWPDVDLAYADGMQVGPSAAHLGGSGTNATVTLAAGASAVATFRYTPASSAADCQADTADQLLVFPPGSSTSSTVTTHLAFCTAQADRPGVTPVTAAS